MLLERLVKAAGLSAGLILLGVPPLAAQVLSGNIYGRVSDESGAVLREATIHLKGATIGGLSTTTGALGDFHFLVLDPGTYTVAVSLKGFATSSRDVIVTTGVNVELAFILALAAGQETVTISAETPVVDTRRMDTGATLTLDELERTPNSRDPWALLRTIPGVLVDRDGIAGSWSHQQANFYGKGADGADNSFILDGTSVTGDGGGSLAYFDFDAFQEISVTTGGIDLRAQAGGININFTTKRGTNLFHGSARGYFTHDSLEWSNLPASLVNDPRLALSNGTFSDTADHILQVGDYGGEMGGPIIKDRLWAWAAYGRQDIRVVRLANGIDNPVKTGLDEWNAKLNWQASDKDMVSVSYFWNAKTKRNLNPGYLDSAAASSLENQANVYPGGLHGLLKLEGSHVFSADWFVNATYTRNGEGYGYIPEGPTGEGFGLNTLTDTSYGTAPAYRQTLVWQMGDVDLRHFARTAGASHELRFGFGYRRTPITSSTSYSGPKITSILFSPAGGVADVYRDGVVSYTAETWDGYLGDTFTRGRLTLKAGLRYDHQVARTLPSSAGANPAFPNLLPVLDFPGGGTGVHWNDLAPRLGATYALDAQGKTVARASYSHYAGRITANDALFDSPLGTYGSFLEYNWVDLNHDGFAQPNEILVNQGVLYAGGGIDAAHPTSPVSSNRIDPHYVARHDDEVILGLDHEVAPGLAIGAAYTWRRNTDRKWTPRIGLDQSNYTANPPVTVDGFTGQTFSPDPTLVNASGGGFSEENRPDYRQGYNGIEVSLTKRLSRKWMVRANGAYMDLHENFLGPAAIQDPTRQAGAPQLNGGQVAGVGLNGGVAARWQVSAHALCELPLGLEGAASFWARQGFVKPYAINLQAGADRMLQALATPSIEDNRLPAVADLDLRLAKTLRVHRGAALVLSADLFNVFNSGTVINRNSTLNSQVFGRILGVLNPRIARFGVRLTF